MMMWGTVIAIVAIVVLTVFIGPYAILVLFAVGFGLLLSTYVRTKEMHADMQKIKEKLGIMDGEELVSNQEIEAELEREMRSSEDRDSEGEHGTDKL